MRGAHRILPFSERVPGLVQLGRRLRFNVRPPRGRASRVDILGDAVQKGTVSSFSRAVICGAGFDPNPKKTKAESTVEAEPVELDDAEIEERLLQRRRRRKRQAAKDDSAPKPETKSLPDPESAQFETAIIYVLGSLFGLILLNGLVIAASGFLPEEVDAFAAKILYPSFTPVVLVFLACSTAYGLWKNQQGK